MRRRTFIAGLGGAAAWPLRARAQQGERVRRIGSLQTLGTEHDQVQQTYLRFTRDALAKLGWIEWREGQRIGPKEYEP